MNLASAQLTGALAAAIFLAALALRPPSPAPASASPMSFSAQRAFADVEAIAQRPRPTGSPEAARMRDYLAGRLRGLGLETVVREGRGAQNVIGVLRGSDSALPAVVLMSHYDSVAAGPGAADDGAGVAAALEVVRALGAAGPHRRDVMVLITDGEEAGLLGARAFFAGDPLRGRVGVVLNMEARGAGGRAVMFETHRQAGGLIAHLNRRGALRGASSLMPDLYRRLPNDTDLSVALAAGHPGLNYAFFADQAAYHMAQDAPERLDRGSLQHLGDQVLAAAAALVDEPRLPAPQADRVYADLLGGPVLAYPPWAGWLILAAAAALGALAAVRARRAGEGGGLEIARGGAALVLMALATGVALLGAALACGWPDAMGALLDHYGLALAGFGLLAAGVALLVLAAAARSYRRWRSTRPWALTLGALGVVWALGAAAQAAAPLDAFMLAWPALAAALAAALTSPPAPPWRRVAAALVLVAAMSQVAYWAGLMFALVGVALPPMLALFAGLGALLLMPWAAPAMAGRAGPALAAAAAISGIVLVWLAAH